MKQPISLFLVKFKQLAILLLTLLLSAISNQALCQKSVSDTVPEIDMVFCLDLSGSTNGLIDNFRENIWSVVNQVNNFSPKQRFRIGVVGFSRPSFGKSSAYVKVLSWLTSDFDQMTADLWKLKPEVEKGDQFVSNALITAAFDMNWSKSKNAVKIIFLVGNGNVNTGSSDYRSVVAEITNKRFQLIPVYCLRTKKTRETDGWQQIGRITDIPYESVWVDKNEPLIKILPVTQKLIDLNKELDRQSVPFTEDGIKNYNNMLVCDNKAFAATPIACENRLVNRVSSGYLNKVKTWDMTDLPIASSHDLLNINRSQLPDSLKKMNVEQLYLHLQQKKETKNRVLSEIEKLLPQARQEYINELVSREEFETNQILEWVILKWTATIASRNGITVK